MVRSTLPAYVPDRERHTLRIHVYGASSEEEERCPHSPVDSRGCTLRSVIFLVFGKGKMFFQKSFVFQAVN